jgi:putative ABC transport system permease protein
MGSWLHDLRFGWRALRRRPAATAAIVSTLALAMGAQLAIFRVFDAVVLRPLPFADDERLVRLYIEPNERTGERLSPGVDVLLALQRETRSFASVVGQRYMDLTLRRPEGPERVTAIGVTAGWADTLGVEPARGRVFHPAEEREGMGSGVALVSHGTWAGLLGGDPNVLGKALELGDRTVTVVGVMPPGFAFPYDAQLWVPLRPEVDALGPWGFFIPARLAPGVSLDAANRELAALAAGRADLPGRTLTAVPIREVLLGDGRGLSVVLFGIVGFLLLLVCANLANLFLVRTLGRSRELAVRAALGASRSRLGRQLLTESLLVAGLAAAVAVVVAAAAQPLLGGLVPEDLHRLGGLPPADGRLAALCLGITLLSALLVGLLPVLRARDAGDVVRAGRSTAPTRRLRALLVGAEVAAALVLLVGAGLLARDLVRRQQLDFGYPVEGLLTFSVSLSEEPDVAVRAAKVERIVTALAELPGVEGAGATCIFPSTDGNYVASTLVEGESEAQPRLVNHRLVTPGFLAATGLRLLHGRGLTTADRAGAEDVAVVSASLAQRRWPDRQAVGQRIREARPGEPPRWIRVVGVVSDVAEFYDVDDTWYLPLAQHVASPRAADMTFVARTAGDAMGLAAAAKRAVATVDPVLAVADVATPSSSYAASLAVQRSTGLLASVFGGLALLVAVVGVYAAMAAWTAERRREVAIRVAVGGTPGRVLRELAGPGLRLVAAGLVVGAAGAAGLRGVLPKLVEDLDTSLSAPLGVAATLLGLAALVACVAPARRALRRDTAVVLREE